MKKQLIADIYNMADALATKTKIAKAMICLAGAVAITGVVLALSTDTKNSARHFFLDNGTVFQADRLRGADFERVENVYRITAQDSDISSLSEAEETHSAQTDDNDNTQ